MVLVTGLGLKVTFRELLGRSIVVVGGSRGVFSPAGLECGSMAVVYEQIGWLVSHVVEYRL